MERKVEHNTIMLDDATRTYYVPAGLCARIPDRIYLPTLLCNKMFHRTRGPQNRNTIAHVLFFIYKQTIS